MSSTKLENEASKKKKLPRIELRMLSFDMEERVLSAIEISGPNFLDRNMTIRTVHTKEPAIVADARERMLKVLVNLLNYATKYADKGTETAITVSLDEKEVRVQISDSGHGIEQSGLEPMFESFYRTKNARQSRVAGSGLCLAIDRGFVESKGDIIWAESTVGEGSTFMFTLPLVIA